MSTKRTKAAPKRKRAPKPKAEAVIEAEKPPTLGTFAAAQALAAAEDADPRAFMLDLAVQIGVATNQISSAANRHAAAVRRGHNPSPYVYSVATLARERAHELVRSFHRLPPLDEAGDLARQLEQTADTLERLADVPPTAGTIYRLTALGCALSRIQTAVLTILNHAPQGGG